MAVIWFRDGRPVTDPWSLECLIFELAAELEMARRELRRTRGLPPEPRLHLVPATSPHPDR